VATKDFDKRIAKLKQKADSTQQRTVRPRRAFILALIVLGLLASFVFTPADNASLPSKTDRGLRSSSAEQDPKIAEILARLRGEEVPASQELAPSISATPNWLLALEGSVEERLALLSELPLLSMSEDLYLSYAQGVVASVIGSPDQVRAGGSFDPNHWFSDVQLWFASALLRVGFIVIAFWPLWLLTAAIGFFGVRFALKPRATDDILGVCDPGNGPFYSGIYGPLRPNNSASGSDFSAPGLACPKRASKTALKNHSLGKILRDYSVGNETTTGLAGVILAYADYPSFVEEERAAEQECDSSEEESTTRHTGIFSNEAGTIEVAATEKLRAVLEAHRALVHFRQMLPASETLSESDNFYAQYYSHIETVAPTLSPLGTILLQMLTPQRAIALASLPARDIAAASLAIEAGKSLVYERVEGGFAQLSRYPHLQARAVLHSLPQYHREYSGDERMTIRQAIVCARRHGDFGRAFRLVGMDMKARALREWLEVLYATKESRESIANIVELDSHLHEIYQMFKENLATAVKADDADSSAPAFAKGLPYKSVVLLQLGQLVKLATSGVSRIREARVSELMEQTRAFQAKLSISARLPGFKRQAEEAEKSVTESGGITKILAQNEKDSELVKKWLIMRRMLTRYNWLSTRVGDDSVPIDGLVQGILRPADPKQDDAVGFDALVPLRQRRFKELLGDKWHRSHYADSPKESSIEVYVDNEEFRDGLKQRFPRAVEKKSKEDSAVA